MEVPNPVIIDPQSPELAAVPETRGIYLFSISGNSPHLSWSNNLKRRLTRLLVPSYTGRDAILPRHSTKLDFIRYWPASSRLEISLLMYELAKQYYPVDYLKHLRLRLPWFVTLTGGDAFPRLEIVNRPSAKNSAVYGPFLSRDLAQRYEQQVLGLFQLRRCTEVLHPSPEHPGCIYGEMNQCLRPCQLAVSQDEYASEVGRVSDFFASNGKSSIALLASARERASTELDFEQAAYIHKRLEKVAAATACRDQVINAANQFNGVAVTKGFGKLQFRLWPLFEGYWQSPVDLEVNMQEASAKSLDQELRESLTAALKTASNQGKRAEQLALFSRWYYSSWREGQWFPFRKLDDLNYRRLVKEISKMAQSDKGKAAN